MPPNPTIDSLTGIRGLAAVWIVLYHYKDMLAPVLPGRDWNGSFLDAGGYAVELFFVLSGFVLAYNYAAPLARWDGRAYARFIALRFARIYPVHLFTLLAVLAMVAAAGATGRAGVQEEGGYGAGDFARNLLLVQTWVPDFRLGWNYPSWSISSEFAAYLLFPVACLGLARLRHPAAIGAALAIALAVSLLLDARPAGVPYRELLRVAGPFAVGCLVARAVRSGEGEERSPRDRGRWPLWLAAAGLVGVAAAPHATATPGPWLIAAFVLVIAGLGARGERRVPLLASAPVVYLGEISYSLYMTHAVVQKPLNTLLSPAGYAGSSPAARAGLVAAYVAVVVGAAVLTYHLVERPCRRWVRAAAGGGRRTGVEGASAVGAP